MQCAPSNFTLAAIVVLLVAAMSFECSAQVEPGPGRVTDTTRRGGTRPPLDTLFVFPPVRPLIDSASLSRKIPGSVGFEILFSSSGLGLGGFVQTGVSSTATAFVTLGITGSRNTDEFPDYDGNVPNKVNRLYTLPITAGIRFRLFHDEVVDNFRPYVGGGIGPAVLVALPYAYSFFASFGHGNVHVTGAVFASVGAEIGTGSPLMLVDARYYFIPYGRGLESIRGNPIRDFGGIFLTMSIGFAL